MMFGMLQPRTLVYAGSNRFFSFFASTFTVLAVLPHTLAETNFTEAQVAIVVQRLADVAAHSWEYGTREQTLVELDTPSFSVLNNTALPPSRTAPNSLSTVIDLITEIVKNRTETLKERNFTNPQPLFPGEGSAADPASNGVTMLIANWTGKSTSGVDFGEAAEEQMAYLWSDQVPKTADGAISHRVEAPQLWSDFVYMVPPFLAYYGVLSENQTMVWEAYNQIRLYRNHLRDPLHGGLWKHVLLGSWSDEGYWSTGNGWAAAGMLRVLGTIKNSQYANSLKMEVWDLTNWVSEIHDAMYPYVRDDGMFHNYVNNDTTFVGAASATLLASTVYRHALLTGTIKHISHAESVRRALLAPTSGEGHDFSNPSTLQDMKHFTSDGYITPVVNPDNFVLEGEKSPEAQAFVVQLYAAWKDWLANGAPGAGGADGIQIRSREMQRHRMRRKRAIQF